MARKKIRFDFDNPWAKKKKSYVDEEPPNYFIFLKKKSLNQKQNFFDGPSH